jgi:hypothetical protein
MALHASVNLPAGRTSKPRSDRPEDAMIESASIYDLSTVIYIVASAMLLNVCALAAVWADREPGNIPTFAPVLAFGL